ncbi:MAG: gamma-aminobutyrate permease, partial [Glutamicibacter sp.]
GPILAFVILIVVIVGQNYQAIVDGNLLQMASSYIGLPIFLLLWLGHWLATRKQPAVAIDPWTAKLN